MWMHFCLGRKRRKEGKRARRAATAAAATKKGSDITVVASYSIKLYTCVLYILRPLSGLAVM